MKFFFKIYSPDCCTPKWYLPHPSPRAPSGHYKDTIFAVDVFEVAVAHPGVASPAEGNSRGLLPS